MILKNLDLLIKADKRVKIRIPVIPGFNDNDELARITDFCDKKGLVYEILPYHTFGEDKKNALEKFINKTSNTNSTYIGE